MAAAVGASPLGAVSPLRDAAPAAPPPADGVHMISEIVRVAIDFRDRRRDKTRYNKFMSELSDALRTPENEVLCRWFMGLSGSISSLNFSTEDLISVALDWEIARATPEILDCFLDFCIKLSSAYSVFSGHCVRRLLAALNDVDQLAFEFLTTCEDDSSATACLERKRRTQEYILRTLVAIYQLVPTLHNDFCAALRNTMPHHKTALSIQRSFFINLFDLTIELPSIFPCTINMAIFHLTQLDMSISDDTTALQGIDDDDDDDDDEDDEGMFRMDEEVEQNGGQVDIDEAEDGGAAAYPEDLDHPISIIDHLMDVTMEVIELQESKLPGSTFEPLWEAFMHSVLPAYHCKRVQFVLFFAWSLEPKYADDAVRRLFGEVADVSKSQLHRQMAMCYIASFLARAQYAQLRLVGEALERLLQLAMTYCRQLGPMMAPEPSRHVVFYAMCQAMFYLISFRKGHFRDQDAGLPFLRSLNLESLLQTVLRPLRYIDSSVRQQFAQTMRELELGVVEPYLGRASLHSMGGLVFSSSRESARDGQQVLETYYPFDPVVPGFQACTERLQTLYNVWTDAGSNDMPNISGVSAASDDFLQAASQPSDLSNATPRSFSARGVRGVPGTSGVTIGTFGSRGAGGRSQDVSPNVHILQHSGLSRSISGVHASASSLSPL